MADILVVDDNNDIASMVSLRLTIAGHTVHSAGDGNAGVEAALSLLPDLVLMDMQMPVMSGSEAVKQLRDKGYSGTIVSLSASAMSHETQEAIQSGCDDSITKPIGIDFEKRILELLVKNDDENSDCR